ncbi:MAG: hypothetical protein JKY48_04835 [Flavobacteriales bacterium]|nr:hypothetical protein [Flavobacteriales bacterium]
MSDATDLARWQGGIEIKVAHNENEIKTLKNADAGIIEDIHAMQIWMQKQTVLVGIGSALIALIVSKVISDLPSIGM